MNQTTQFALELVFSGLRVSSDVPRAYVLHLGSLSPADVAHVRSTESLIR